MDNEGDEPFALPVPPNTAPPRDRFVRTGAAVGQDTLTVLQLLDEMRKGWDEKHRQVFSQAILNERFLSGRQEYEIPPLSQTVLKAERNVEVPYIIRNQLRNLSLTWAARVNESTNDTRAWADKPGLAQGIATVAQLHLLHQKEKQNRPRQTARAAMLGLPHGSVYFKVTLDPTKGPKAPAEPVLDDEGVPKLDENGEVMVDGGYAEGDICVDLMTIFDVITDGSEDIEHAQWACCRRLLDKYEAKALLMQVGFQEEPTPATDRKSVWDEDLTGVDAYEIWMIPCARVPAGMFALVVGDVVVDYRDFPYAHGQLPFACWKIFDRRDSQYGDTHVTEAIGQQRALNELTSALINMAFKHGTNVYGVAASAIYDQIEEGMKLLDAKGIEDATGALAFITSPEPPQMLLTVIQMLLEAIPEGFGVNEVVASGGAPAQTKSARQLAYIKALDGQKLWLPLQNLVNALIRVDWQQTHLAQQFIRPQRMLEIVGAEHELEVQAFYDCDLRTSIRIEATSASENTRAANAADAEESAVAGFMPPAVGAELRETGLDETQAQAQSRRTVQQQIAAVVQGEQVQPDPSVDPQTAVTELQMAIEVWGQRNPQAAGALQQLAGAYQQQAQQAQQQMQQEASQPMGQPKKTPLADQQQQQQQEGMPS